MNKFILAFLVVIIPNLFFSQNTNVTLYDKSEVAYDLYYFRAYKGDILWFNIQTELKNEKKGTYNELNNIQVYKQPLWDEKVEIINKNDVSKLDIKINVPTDAIYTLRINDGNNKKWKTSVFVQRIAKNDSTAKLNKKTYLVSVPDTLHYYSETKQVLDYKRIATPFIKEDTMPKYNEEQVFIDVAYALRIDNEFVIPISLPLEIEHDFKRAKSVQWGFTISVGNEVYKALQGKMSSVITGALNIGVGKIMSGPADDLGKVDKNKIQAGYEIFDKLSTANAVAGITGDIGDQTKSNKVVVTSNVVQTVTGFTGLTDLAGQKLGSFAPKITDKVRYRVYNSEEYAKYINKQPAQPMIQGNNGSATALFDISDPNKVYYLVIENDRKSDTWSGVGKTLLSQYVYLNVKVFVNHEITSKYNKGYYENTYEPVYIPAWDYKQEVKTQNYIIFEEQLKPYYKILRENLCF